MLYFSLLKLSHSEIEQLFFAKIVKNYLTNFIFYFVSIPGNCNPFNKRYSWNLIHYICQQLHSWLNVRQQENSHKDFFTHELMTFSQRQLVFMFDFFYSWVVLVWGGFGGPLDKTATETKWAITDRTNHTGPLDLGTKTLVIRFAF